MSGMFGSASAWKVREKRRMYGVIAWEARGATSPRPNHEAIDE